MMGEIKKTFICLKKQKSNYGNLPLEAVLFQIKKLRHLSSDYCQQEAL